MVKTRPIPGKGNESKVREAVGGDQGEPCDRDYCEERVGPVEHEDCQRAGFDAREGTVAPAERVAGRNTKENNRLRRESLGRGFLTVVVGEGEKKRERG